MIGNREELSKPLKTNLVITVMGSESDQNTLRSFFQETIDQIYSTRLTINGISSIEEFKIERSQMKSQLVSGLVNTNWISKVTSTRPSVFVLIKQLSETTSRDNEKQWIKEIQTISQALPDTFIYLIILTGTFPMIADTGESDSIFKLKEIKSLLSFTSLEAIKKSTDMRKIHMNILKSAKDYYTALKEKYKKKAGDSSIRIEQKVKYLVKTGVVSLIKNRKPKVKYFDEAYKLLYNYNDMTKYYYGENKLLSFSEIRAAADWLFFQVHKVNKVKKELSKEAFIIKANQHLSKFSHNMFIEPNKPEDQFFDFCDQYWGYKLNDFIGEETALSIRNVVLNNFSGFYYLKAAYCLMRMIHQLPLYDNLALDTVVIDSKKYPIDALKRVHSKYYEKPATYSDFKDFLTPKHYGFNMELFIRYFILDNNLNYDNLNGIVRQSLFPKILKTFESKGSSQFDDIGFYLKTLNLVYALQEEQSNDLVNLYDLLLFSKTIWRYPLVYFTFINKLNAMWLAKPQLSLLDKERLLKGIILIANSRDLTQKEEEVFFSLIGDPELKESSTLAKSPIRLKSNDEDSAVNRLFNFNYSIEGGNTTRNILDSVEFQFTISTCSHSPIRFSSVSVCFAYDKRFKKFTAFDNDLTEANPIRLMHRILLKSNEKALIVRSVSFELERCPLVFEYKLHSKKESVVLVKQKRKNLLEFKVAKSVKIGVNELYNIHCEIVKDETVNVDIGYMTIDFERIHTISDITIKATPSPQPLSQAPTSLSSFLSSTAPSSTSKPQSNSMRSTFEQLMSPSHSSVQASSGTSTATLPASSMQSMQLPSQEFPLEMRPEFFAKDAEGVLISKGHKASFKLDNYEVSSKTVSFLVKFADAGWYTIGFNARYKIMKQEVTDDQIESKESGRIAFQVINPFEIKYELDSSQYMSLNKQKNFNVNSKVKVSLIITNLLEEDALISSISTDKANEDISISTPLDDILQFPQSVSQPILTMMKASWFAIPFEVISIKEFNGKVGTVKINWSTSSLRQYSSQLVNTNKFDLPELSILSFSFDFSYSIPKEIAMDDEVTLVIQFHNKELSFKRIIFLFDSSEHFALNGILKKRLMVYPNETKEMAVRLIPLTQGKSKLPPCKIMEFPIHRYDSKLNSIYYFPDSVLVKPSEQPI